MNFRSLPAIVLFLAGATATWAQPSGSGTPRILSLEECLRLGIDSSAPIHAGDASVEERRARLAEMKMQILPSALLSTSYVRLSDIDAGTLTATNPVTHAPVAEISLGDPILDTMAMRLSVQQPLFLGLRIRGATEQSAAMLDAATGDRDRMAQSIATAIEKAYWSAAGAKESASVFADYVSQAKRHLQDTTNFLAQGLVTRNEVLKAQMRLSGAETQQVEADTALVAARMRLNLLLGRPWDAPVDTEPLPDQAPADDTTTADVKQLITAGLSFRRELDSARARIRADEAALRMARAPLCPNVFLTGDVTMADPNQRYFPQTNEFKTTWSIGVLATLDAGKIPATLAQVEQASARLRRDTEALSSTIDTITQDVVTAYLNMQKSRQQVLNAEAFLAQADDNMRTTRSLFDTGAALDADVADAEATLLSARLQHLTARIAVLTAASDLRLAIGQAPTGIR
ncbi:MAG TPA: TolC family protein [bacterium]|nr:TolC family protein [bacterium]